MATSPVTINIKRPHDSNETQNNAGSFFKPCIEKITSVSSKLFSTIMNGITSIISSKTYTKKESAETAQQYLKTLNINSKTLNDFATYFDKYCANQSNGVSFKQALTLANEGRDLFQKIQQGSATKPGTFEDAQKDMSKLIWFFTYCSVDQGKEFTSGTFCLKDTKVLEHFKVAQDADQHLYTRGSSHYKGRATTHYGINVKRNKDQALPVDKQTGLMGEIDIPGQEEKGVYLKMERSGCNTHIFSRSAVGARARKIGSIKQTIQHGLDFNLFQRIKKAVGFKVKEKDDLPKQKEHLPADIKKAFKEMAKATGIKYNQNDLKKYGIAYIHNTLNAEKLLPNLNTVQKVEELLKEYGDSASYRKGDEVFIPKANQFDSLRKAALINSA